MPRMLLALAVSLTCWSVATNASGSPGELTQKDNAAVVAATLRYRDAWLANNPSMVMATLTRDAVLLPSSLQPIVGEKAIRAFWWPADGSTTTVTAMDQIIDEVLGDGSVAMVRGHGSLTFTLKQNGQERSETLRSTFINILKRQADGSWLIARRMWSDLR
ncbi:MAG TPA: nuclear transport factor 2 family protein [Vicinamibacterales bacterium]|jgi:uncharacterized protein (TIGR02246 family)|nr:nuclear transport factor 2 family protein [Vicinamibacterales bacterium]